MEHPVNFFKFFFAFHNKPTSDNTQAKFHQNWSIFIFRHLLVHCRPLCTSKDKNWPILTKFGVCIVWSRLIMKSKKNFEKIYFLDRFLSWSAHCARSQSEILIFFSKFQNIHMLGILKQSVITLGMLVLLSRSENEGTCYTHVHCARRPKIF